MIQLLFIFEHMYRRKTRKIEIMKEKYKKVGYKWIFYCDWWGIVVEFTI